jgi:carbon-monoxide dehydrogenase medium subunit
MTLLPSMKLRLSAPARLIDLADLDELKGIGIGTAQVVVGGMSCHGEVAGSAALRAAIPALADLAGGIGDPQVRNRGTIAGSVANNDPAADYPAALLGLAATIRTTEREIAADEFFTGLFATDLKDDELILSVSFPLPTRAAYLKFRAPGSRYALVGVMVAETSAGVRVAVTGAGPGVFRVPAMETALEHSFRPESLAGLQVDAEELNADMHGSAEYRAHLVAVLARRATAAALAHGG